MGLLRGVIAGLICVLVVMAGPVAAQFMPQPSAVEAPVVEAPPPSPNDTREFLRLLDDPSVRQWLKDSLEGTQAQQAVEAEDIRAEFRGRLAKIGERIQSLGVAWTILPKVPELLQAEWQAQISKAQKVRSVTYILIFLLVGAGLEWLYRQNVSLLLLRIEQEPKVAPLARFKAASLRAGLLFAGLAIFALGSIGAFLQFEWHPLIEALVLDILVMVVVLRVVMTCSMFVMAPFSPELRQVPMNSRVARFMHRVILAVTLAVVIALTQALLLERLAAFDGAHPDTEVASLAQTVVLALQILLVVWGAILLAFFWVPRIVDTPEAVNPARIRFWRMYLLVSTALVFGLWLIGARGPMWAVVVLSLVPPMLLLTRAWVDHVFDQSTQARETEHRAEAQAALDAVEAEMEAPAEAVDPVDDAEPVPEIPEFHDPYATARPIVHRVTRFFVLLFAVLLLASSFGVDVFALSDDRGIFGRVLKVLLDSIVAILIADLIWTWAKTVIDKRIADYEPPVDGQAPGPEARMITLLPLLRVILMVTLLVVVFLSVLTAVGVNVAPLLAGAGVLGIAIGFGTQSLVRDIISGIFFLIDDAFRLGEYIEVGDLMGSVESISIRSMRIRHHRGKVHTVPYGELKSLTNHSRDWVIMKLEFRVPFDTDLQLVKKLVKKVGAELQANEHYGASILSTLKSQGVRRMEEFNMVVGVKFMTKPGEQWLVRRDAYQKVRDIFEANGIKMAERNVRVEIAGKDAEHLTEEDKQAIAGAAQEAAQGPAGPEKPIPDEP